MGHCISKEQPTIQLIQTTNVTKWTQSSNTHLNQTLQPSNTLPPIMRKISPIRNSSILPEIDLQELHNAHVTNVVMVPTTTTSIIAPIKSILTPLTKMKLAGSMPSKNIVGWKKNVTAENNTIEIHINDQFLTVENCLIEVFNYGNSIETFLNASDKPIITWCQWCPNGDRVTLLTITPEYNITGFTIHTDVQIINNFQINHNHGILIYRYENNKYSCWFKYTVNKKPQIIFFECYNDLFKTAIIKINAHNQLTLISKKTMYQIGNISIIYLKNVNQHGYLTYVISSTKTNILTPEIWHNLCNNKSTITINKPMVDVLSFEVPIKCNHTSFVSNTIKCITPLVGETLTLMPISEGTNTQNPTISNECSQIVGGSYIHNP
jgi:hypothetical protein